MSSVASWLVRRRGVVILGAVLTVVGWWFSAYPRGMAMAWWDGVRGRDIEKIYGMMQGTDPEYARLLRERYGVEFDVVAGCVVTSELRQYADGYNAVSRPRVRAKWGKDVFTECLVDATALVNEALQKAGVAP